MLFALAGTLGIGYEEGKEEHGMTAGVIDIVRAYFHAPANREVYVELPA